VYRLENRMLPTHLVYSGHPRHVRLANIAFGGEDRRMLRIVQALTGNILPARSAVPCTVLHGHA
jgi:hypothetical protein